MRFDFRKTVIYAGIAVFLMAAAFVCGTAVSADVSDNAVPGSSADPLVSESYVKARVAALEAKIAELEAQVAQLEKGAGKVPSGTTGTSGSSSASGTSGNSGTSTGSGSGTVGTIGTTSPIDSTNSGMSGNKKVTILPLQTAANVRSAPNLQASVLIKASSGAALIWLQTSGEWYKVQLLDGRTGWVHNSVAKLT